MKKIQIYTAGLIVAIMAIGTMNLFAQQAPKANQKTGTLQVLDGTVSGDMNTNSLIEMQSDSKGLRFTRVALVRANLPDPLSAHVEGMTVYNTATSDVSVPYKDYVSPGLYYNDGTKWVRMSMGYNNWFYMPSVSFDTSVQVDGATKDLYALYSSQFTTPKVKNPSAPNSVPYIPAATDLYYYITDYDTSVFANVSIDNNGLMTYDVINAANDCSLINIIFVLK